MLSPEARKLESETLSVSFEHHCLNEGRHSKDTACCSQLMSVVNVASSSNINFEIGSKQSDHSAVF